MQAPKPRLPVGKVELSFACHHLSKLDTFSKSDPYVIVKIRDETGIEPWKQILKTETIKDNQNPKFKSTVIVDYYFERVQLLKFEVWDDDAHKPDFQGDFECKLGEIVGARGQLITAVLKDVKHSHRKGSITVFAEEVYSPPQFNFQQQASTIPPPSADLLTEIAQLQHQLQVTPPTVTAVAQHFRVKCSGKHLDKKDTFGKSDPYFKIFRIREQESILVHESEVIMKTLDPEWKILDIDLQKLSNNDPHRPLRFEVYDWDKHSEHDLIGVFETSVHQILNERKEFPIINARVREKKGKDYKDSGIFYFENPSLTNVENLSIPNPAYQEMNQRLQNALAVKAKYDFEYAQQFRNRYQVVNNQNSFLQYLAGGCEVSLMVAIDFTGSNGHPLDQISLHYISSKPNEYQQAISAVGNILADYDYDKVFPVYGFGGKYHGKTDHCFPLREPDGNCRGVEGILSTYAEAIRKYDLSGPTYFHEVIATARSLASANATQQNQKYFILLIITDGVIESINKTIAEIIGASNLPLSIVIVGVGSADFGTMDALDADQKPLETTVNGKAIWASRDIVQFVPFSKYKHNPQKLAEETLAEIPRQLVSFMGLNGIVPNPKVVVQPQIPIPPQ